MSIGIGPLFFHEKYNIWLAMLGLLVIIGACYSEMRIQRSKLQAQANEQVL